MDFLDKIKGSYKYIVLLKLNTKKAYFRLRNRNIYQENKEKNIIFGRNFTMMIYKVKSYEEMSKKAASIIASQIIIKPDSVLGLATGSSPVGTYQNLIELYKKGYIDFSRITSINLDEYKGLEPTNDQSYRYFMNTNLFDHVNIDKKATFVPDGLEMDSDKACGDYEKIIESYGGIDLQLLGIGRNGHIGFNEPGPAFIKDTHCTDLTQSTIDANKRFFASEEDVPHQAYSMGIGSIMKAKKILLIACGEDKADAMAKTINGPITPEVPASILQLHKDVVIIADEAALSKL